MNCVQSEPPAASMGLEFARRLTARVLKPLKATTAAWDHLRMARVFTSAPRWSTADAEIKCPPPLLPVGAQGYQTFPLYKPVVGRNIALRAVPAYRASTYLVSVSPAHSTSFSLSFFNPQLWNVY